MSVALIIVSVLLVICFYAYIYKVIDLSTTQNEILALERDVEDLESNLQKEREESIRISYELSQAKESLKRVNKDLDESYFKLDKIYGIVNDES